MDITDCFIALFEAIHVGPSCRRPWLQLRSNPFVWRIIDFIYNGDHELSDAFDAARHGGNLIQSCVAIDDICEVGVEQKLRIKGFSSTSSLGGNGGAVAATFLTFVLDAAAVPDARSRREVSALNIFDTAFNPERVVAIICLQRFVVLGWIGPKSINPRVEGCLSIQVRFHIVDIGTSTGSHLINVDKGGPEGGARVDPKAYSWCSTSHLLKSMF